MRREDADDPMMSELHAIRERHERQALSARAKRQPRPNGNRITQFLSSHGYHLVPTTRGTQRLVRRVIGKR